MAAKVANSKVVLRLIQKFKLMTSHDDAFAHKIFVKMQKKHGHTQIERIKGNIEKQSRYSALSSDKEQGDARCKFVA